MSDYSRPRTRRERKNLGCCQDCGEKLTDANWTPSNQKYKRYICGRCWVIRQNNYAAKNPNHKEKTKARRKQKELEWSDERRLQEYRRAKNNALKKNYGITLEDYEIMLAEQHHRCYLCDTDEPEGKGGFHVDHCHRTSQIRRLLCSRCNMMLGLVRDNPEVLLRSIKYLMDYSTPIELEEENK